MLGGLKRMLGGNELVLAGVIMVVLGGILVVLFGILQGLLGGIEVIAGLTRGGQVSLQIHGVQPGLGDLGQGLEYHFTGEIGADHQLKLHIVIGNVHIQRGLTAEQRGAAGLHLVQRQGGDLAQFIAKLHLLNGAVQRCQGAVQRTAVDVHLQQSHVKGLGRLDDLILRIAELKHNVGVVLLQLAVFKGVKGVPQGLIALLEGAGGIRV